VTDVKTVTDTKTVTSAIVPPPVTVTVTTSK
jgi:hypothetical protein